jgi:hypothetical protein
MHTTARTALRTAVRSAVRIAVRIAVRTTVRTTVFLTLLLPAIACRDDRKTAATTVADSAVFAPPPLAPVASRFDVPLDYDFTPVMEIVERTVPKTFGSIDELHVAGTDSNKHYAYTATRGPFTAVADGPVVRLRTTLSYQARGWYKPRIGPTLSAGCGNGDERPRITAELTTPLTLNEHWHLVSKSSVARVEPASSDLKDRCTVSIANFDVTDRVVDAARRGITSQLPKIDKKVGSVSLAKRAEGWWTLLNRPIRLANGVWLMLQPQQLRLGKITGAGHTLTVRAGLDALPKIVTGAQPSDSASPLPPLAHESVTSGYHIMIDGLIDYTTASAGVTKALRGQTYTQGGQTVRVRWVTVAPTRRGQLVLTVQFEGDTDGRLLLVGLPHYDAVHGVMTVPDLDYDLATSNQVVNAYTWLRSDALRNKMRELATVSVQPALDRGKTLLLAGLNRKLGDAVTLAATVDSVAARGVYVTPDGLLVRAEAVGDARMSVQKGEKGEKGR